MKIEMVLSEKDLRELIRQKFDATYKTRTLKDTEIVVKVKSKQNYKSEWEVAAFKAEVVFDDSTD